jgi:acetyl esterase/lipase
MAIFQESIKSKIYKLILRLTNSKQKIEREFESGIFNKRDCPNPPDQFYVKYHITKNLVLGRIVYKISPKEQASTNTIIYLHGGAYIHKMAKQHWAFVAKIIDATQCQIIVPDYPLAPAYTYMDAYKMLMNLYKDLITNTLPQSIVLMGDSAGGGFAFGLAQKLRNESLPQPSKIIMLSPWLDLTLDNPAIDEVNKKDPFLGIDGLRKCACAYSGNTDLSNYLLSPINGTLTDLPKIVLFTGTHDILWPDASLLAQKLIQLKINFEYFEYPQMIHVWMILAMPEANDAFCKIVKQVNSLKVGSAIVDK